MKSINPGKDKIKAITSGVALSSTIAFSSAFADDTEVFFGRVTTDSTTQPNVLFVLDTSGSMDSYDNTSKSRLERMKDAMHTILDETANVNVGLMRFNGYQGGGAVLHPIKPIDDTICSGAACGTISVASKVSQSAADSEQIDDSGAIDLDGNSLSIGETAAGTKQTVGLHFEELNIPQGATITSATLEFRSHADRASVAAYNIYAEQVDDADLFTDTNNDLASRTLGQSVAWNPAGWLADEDYNSEDISPVIQEIVDRANWCGGNDINVLIDGTGQRSIRSYDAWATSAPTLRLNYTTDNIPTGGGCMRAPAVSQVSHGLDDAEERLNGNNYVNTGSSDLELWKDGWRNQMIGIRFANLDVPQGAVIESAVIDFTTDRDRSGSVSLNIAAQAIGDAPQFDSGTRRDVSNRATTGTTVPWNNLPTAAVGESVSTPDISALVQDVVSRGDWSRGNAAAFIFSGNGGTGFREYESFNGSSNNAPKLRIIYRHVIGTAEDSQITVRDELKGIVNEMVAHDGTPIVEAYYEAALYMTGRDVDYGLNRGTTNNWWSEPKYQRTSHPDSWVTGTGTVDRNQSCSDDNLNSAACASERIIGSPTYISPMVSACQSNHIVFLTDGQPSSHFQENKVKALIGADSCATAGGNGERCGRELAHWLHDTDHNPHQQRKQNISTYTIGFNYQGQFLKDLASEGAGQYFEADSADELVTVFNDILGDVTAVDTSFVAPGATVNQFNRLTHRNDIYFALFKPAARPTWDGNLKRYEVDLNDAGEIAILDVNGDSAVDESSGFFHDDAKSWWSDDRDGNAVELGGAAEQLDFTRNTFTYLGDYATLPTNGADLTANASRLDEGNNNITLDHLGIQNLTGSNQDRQDRRTDLLKWVRGIDVQDEDDDNDTTDYRKHIGDPMHARPVILNYATNNPEEALSTVFVGTNEGYLHAIEREEGKELFGFMPKELLGNIQPYFTNHSSTTHPYGLDGALSIWTNDDNNNVMVDSNETAYLYTGMRRGGNNYYALDVSDRENPKLAWVIEGGPGGTPGFEELGQTWSRAVPNKIMFNNVERDVLIFAAGYDVNQDPDPTGQVMEQTPDSIGRGFYIVDAATGDLIWSVLGSNTGNQQIADMDYSVPSDIRALDTNNDGLTDQLYFGDMGGQIWRFDFAQYHQSGDGALLQGGIIAKLSGSSDQNQRRFYYEPDIAVASYEGERFLSISIGSGWRAHPLNTDVEDRFYVLRSDDVLGAPQGYGKLDSDSGQYSPITEADLIDVTTDIDADAGPYGWFLDLDASGEKVLGNSVTVNNQVIFSSYRPEASTIACTPAIGGGSVYVLNILNGSPRIDMDGDDDVDEDDRSTELAHGGIPPEPAVLITEHGPTVLVGPEQPVKPDFDNLTQRTYWYKPGDDTAHDLVESTVD